MKCPACQRVLEECHIGRLAVDVCRGGCGGIWFDNFELPHADDPQDFAGHALLDIQSDPSVQVDPSQKRGCPRCGDVVMMRHFHSELRRIVVDTCPKCGGVWLDGGELAQIREECGSKTDKAQAAQAYFNKMFRADLGRIRRKP